MAKYPYRGPSYPQNAEFEPDSSQIGVPAAKIEAPDMDNAIPPFHVVDASGEAVKFRAIDETTGKLVTYIIPHAEYQSTCLTLLVNAINRSIGIY